MALLRINKNKIIETDDISLIVADGEKFKVYLGTDFFLHLTKEEGTKLIENLTIED